MVEIGFKVQSTVGFFGHSSKKSNNLLVPGNNCICFDTVKTYYHRLSDYFGLYSFKIRKQPLDY